MAWKASEKLMDTIRHYAQFPATGVSLRQMVQFGDKPSTGSYLPTRCFPQTALVMAVFARVLPLPAREQCQARATEADCAAQPRISSFRFLIRAHFRDLIPSFTISFRGASHPLSPQSPRIGRLARRRKRHALGYQGQGLVRPIFRSESANSLQEDCFFLVKQPCFSTCIFPESFSLTQTPPTQEITQLPRPELDKETRDRLMKPSRHALMGGYQQLSEATPNPSIDEDPTGWGHTTNGNGNGNGSAKAKSLSRRYYATVDDTGAWPAELHLYNQRFAQTLHKIKRRHDGVVTTMAQGILEYKRKRQRLQIDSSIQSFLDRFYMSRIGIRMLLGQHIALTDQSHHRDPTYVGVICTKTNVQDLAQEAIENARFVCEDHYGLFEAPKVQLVCNPNLDFMYVPGHLSHMLFETLKNSLRAVVETHGMDKQEFPVTKVIVAEGKEDITIKISDEGGGIPRSAIPLVWTYMYTTVDRTPNLDPDFDKSDFKAPMAGFGYGLPISRLYARYFGGDLKLISMEG